MVRARVAPLRATALAWGVAAIATAWACVASSAADAQVETVLRIRAIYPREAAALASEAITLFNDSHFTTKEGIPLTVTGASFDSIPDLKNLLAGDPPAQLWIAPLAAIRYAQELSDAPLTPSLCAPLMSSSLGVAFRSVDAFGPLASPQGVSAAALFTPESTSLSGVDRSLIIGSPRFTSSGLASLEVAASLALRKAPALLNRDDIDVNVPPLRATQRTVRSLFLSDTDALAWLANSHGGQPLALITTAQQFEVSRSRQRDLSLRWSPFNEPHYEVEYHRCLIDRRSAPLLSDDVRDILTSFFSIEKIGERVATHHFHPLKQGARERGAQGAVVQSLITHWSEIARPAVVTFVLDTSLRNSRDRFESIRGEIQRFAGGAAADKLSIGIVPTTTTINRPLAPTNDKRRLSRSISALSTSGTNALWDALGTALTFTSDLDLRSYRRAIVVITSSDDITSQFPLDQLTARARHLVTQRGVELRVLAIGESPGEFAKTRTLVETVGGHFNLLSIDTLPGELRRVVEEVG